MQAWTLCMLLLCSEQVGTGTCRLSGCGPAVQIQIQVYFTACGLRWQWECERACRRRVTTCSACLARGACARVCVSVCLLSPPYGAYAPAGPRILQSCPCPTAATSCCLGPAELYVK